MTPKAGDLGASRYFRMGGSHSGCPKKDCKSVRICGDFSVTVNPVSKLDRYPIPKVEDLFARLSKGKLFSKLDLSQAYQQLTLDENSKKYVVINTHRGLFRYMRLHCLCAWHISAGNREPLAGYQRGSSIP